MSHSEHDAPILRTSPRRMGKMLAIIIGIQIVGGLIFFTHYDFWNSYLPIAGQRQEAGEHQAGSQGTATGAEHDVSLKFVESSDFKNYGFNAPLGQTGANPEIDVNVGDKIVFDVTNA